MSRRALPALGALAAYAFFIASVLLMPYLNEGYSPTRDTISEGALGEHGWVQVAGFFALAAGTLTVAWMLHEVAPPPSRIAITTLLLVISAASVIMLAVIPTDDPGDRTLQGGTHLFAAAIAFITAVAAMLWSGYAFRGHTLLDALARLSLIAGLVAAVLLVITGSGLDPSGLWQRLTVWCELAWFIAVAIRLGTTGERSPGGPSTQLR